MALIFLVACVMLVVFVLCVSCGSILWGYRYMGSRQPPHPALAASLLPAEKLLLTADLLVVRSGRCAADKGAEA